MTALQAFTNRTKFFGKPRKCLAPQDKRSLFMTGISRIFPIEFFHPEQVLPGEACPGPRSCAWKARPGCRPKICVHQPCPQNTLRHDEATSAKAWRTPRQDASQVMYPSIKHFENKNVGTEI